jgi:type II secretory pathway component PulF
MRAQQKHLFYAELAKLLAAGFGIRQAAAVMLAGGLPRAQAGWLRAMEQGLESGRSISEALGGDATAVSELERSMLGAGERGGRLDAALQHLADYFGMLAAVRAEALKRLVYPFFMVHVGVFVVVLPQPLLGADAAAGSLGGRMLLALLVVYAGGLGLLWLGRALLNAARRHARLDHMLNRIPVLRSARNNLAMARFTKVYHMGILAGLSMVETAETAARAAHSAALSEAGHAMAQAASAGNELGPVLLALPAFPKAFARSYATAEQAGTLDKDLERWAAVFQADAARAAATLASVLTTLISTAILLLVAWGVWNFYSGYFNSLQRLGEQ